jgi:hypothetical protein
VSAGITHPDSPYELRDEPGELPDGYGALALRIRQTRWTRRKDFPPVVGVDGRPVAYGFGDATVILPAGEHIVEVQFTEPVAARRVVVAPGAVEPIEYVVPRNLVGPGSLGPPPQRPRGVPLAGVFVSMIVALLAVVLAILVLKAAGLTPVATAPIAFGLGIAVVVGTILWFRR